MSRRSSILLRAFLLTLCAALVGCDHASKSVATTALANGKSIELVPRILNLQYAENHDTAFSLLTGVSFPHKHTILAVLSAAILLATLVVWFRKRNAGMGEQIAYAMITAGAIGNVADRVVNGFVVDFIHLTHWPVFNVADILIVCGMLLLMLQGVRRRAGPHSAESG